MTQWPEGPMGDVEFPDRLTAHVVTPGEKPSIHGFRVADDLAPNYSFAEVILISLTGEAPSEDAGRAFEVGLVFLAPSGVDQAPAHAARLAQVCAAHVEKVVAVGAVALTERARSRIAKLDELFEWLADGSRPYPDAARDPAATSAVASFRDALPVSYRGDPVFAQAPSLDAAVLTVLWRCGVNTTSALVATLTVAALACVSAEAFAEKPAAIRGYPARLPSFSYVERTK